MSTKQKKIGLDLRLFGNDFGGLGRYSKELFLRVILKSPNNSYFGFYNPKTMADKDLKFLKTHQNLTLVPAIARHYSFAEQTSFLRLLLKFNLDLVHFPNFNVPLFYKRPFVVTIHDLVHHKISGAKKSRLLHFYAYKRVIESAAKAASAIITVSESSKKDIEKILKVPADKISVIYEGSFLHSLVKMEQLLRVKNNYIINKPYFLFVGVLERKKNLVNLTRGFDLFLQRYGVDMLLVVVGKTDKHYPEIKHKALDIKRRGNLVFTGPVEDWELEALYKGAFAFTSASLHEGFGLPGVEALGFGLPLAVSNLEVFNEVYDNAAIYFNPLDPSDIADKLFLLVRDEMFSQQLAKNALLRSRLYSWDKTVSQTLEVYDRILTTNSL